jgi:hypothetical protein
MSAAGNATQAVHALLSEGHGLLECARRLGWALNTVKRYARAASTDDLTRASRYRATLLDPFRDHLRRRRALPSLKGNLAHSAHLALGEPVPRPLGPLPHAVSGQ